MYRAITRQIEVTVVPNFLPGTLVDRTMRIFLVLHHRHHQYRRGDRAAAHPALDHHRRPGRRQEVRGEGVVGEQPVLAPGQRFEYTCGVPLPTASGFMSRPLPDGERFRRALRDRRPDLLARQPGQQAGVELTAIVGWRKGAPSRRAHLSVWKWWARHRARAFARSVSRPPDSRSTTLRHTPRKRSIQYAAAFRFKRGRRDILDHPPAPVIGRRSAPTRWRVTTAGERAGRVRAGKDGPMPSHGSDAVTRIAILSSTPASCGVNW